MSRDAQGMVEEAKRLSNSVPGIVVKIPVTAEGLAAIKLLKKEGIPTLGTAVYSASQGLLAALAGAKYVAPYVNRVDAQWRGRHPHGAGAAIPAGNACAREQSSGGKLQNATPGRWIVCWLAAKQSPFH